LVRKPQIGCVERVFKDGIDERDVNLTKNEGKSKQKEENPSALLGYRNLEKQRSRE
jgi:hypothetical protein